VPETDYHATTWALTGEANPRSSNAVEFRGLDIEEVMKQSETYRQNAENCAYLAEGANEPTRQRYRRMEAAWRALADEQDWLDGEASPDRKSEQ
jgi:hypothetical protein